MLGEGAGRAQWGPHSGITELLVQPFPPHTPPVPLSDSGTLGSVTLRPLWVRQCALGTGGELWGCCVPAPSASPSLQPFCPEGPGAADPHSAVSAPFPHAVASRLLGL